MAGVFPVLLVVMLPTEITTEFSSLLRVVPHLFTVSPIINFLKRFHRLNPKSNEGLLIFLLTSMLSHATCNTSDERENSHGGG